MRESRAQSRDRFPLSVTPGAPHPNDELARRLDALREIERERPERIAAAIGLVAFAIVACGAALLDWAVLA